MPKEEMDNALVKLSPIRLQTEWKGRAARLYTLYLSAVESDPVFLMAAALDPREGPTALSPTEWQTTRKLIHNQVKPGVQSEIARAREEEATCMMTSSASTNSSESTSKGRFSHASASRPSQIPSLAGGTRQRTDFAAKDERDAEDLINKALDKLEVMPLAANFPSNLHEHYSRNDVKCLRPLALSILAIPATEAPAERLFSSSGRVVSPLRVRISDASLAATVFLKQNSSLLKQTM
jgi:hypothetical protein